MNVIICALNNPKYSFNSMWSNPGLVTYNGRSYVNILVSLFSDILQDQDRLYLFVSEESMKESIIQERITLNTVLKKDIERNFFDITVEPCLFIHADEIFAEDDICDFYNFCKNNENESALTVKSNPLSPNSNQKIESKVSGMFWINSFLMKEMNAKQFIDICDIFDIEQETIFRNSVSFCLTKENYLLHNKNSLLKLYHSVEFPKEKNIVQLFQETVKKNCDKIAITCLEQSLTYQELDELTDCIALNILKKKKSGTTAGILLERGVGYIACMLGIMKAGLTYVPMSILYPLGRLDLIYQTAELAFVITSQEFGFAEKYPNRCVYYDELTTKCGEVSKLYQEKIPSNSLAYIMFTSGSTGKPKGVEITHRNILNNAFFLHRKVFEKGSSVPKLYGVLAEFVFDMSVQQIYPALLFGYNLVIYPSSKDKSPKKLIEFLNQVDTSDATPIMLEMITSYMQNNKEVHLGQVHLVVGGEKLELRLCKRYFASNSKNEITNIYGPTECTVEVSTCVLSKDSIEYLDDIPIGDAVDNSRVYVLNENNKFLENGQIGEICVAGECVGKGYKNAPELTAEVYVDDILTGEKMYKTGDYGFWKKDGKLYYVGRKDQQLKINGYRVDLGDIENTIINHTPIKEVKILMMPVENCGEKLVAYFVQDSKDLRLEQILKSVKDHLPAYMIPSFFVPVNAFPLNINGKLDIQKLPECKKNALKEQDETNCFLFQEGEASRKILKYIAKTLNEDAKNIIGVSLRSLGCDSVFLLQLLSYISIETGIDVPITSVPISTKVYELLNLIQTKTLEAAPKTNSINEKYRISNKRKYHCLPMQNYLLDSEYEYWTLTGEHLNDNTMIYLWMLKKDINIALLKNAIMKVVEASDAFYMRFEYGRENSKAVFSKEHNITVDEVTVEVIDKKTILDLTPAYDYRKTPLAHFTILTCNEKQYLLITAHHLIFDYLSCLSLLNNIELFYNENKCKSNSFFHLLNEMNKKLNSEVNLVTDKSITQYYEKTRYTNLKKNTDLFGEKKTAAFSILEADVDKIRSYSESNAVSEFGIFLYLYLKALAELTNQDELTVGTFINGRSQVLPIDTIGFFSKFIPFSFILKNHEDSIQVIKKIEEQIQKIEKVDYRLSIYDMLSSMKEQCNVLYDYQKLTYSSQKSTLFQGGETYDFAQINYDLVLRLYEDEKKITARFEYASSVGERFVDEVFEKMKKLILEEIK